MTTWNPALALSAPKLRSTMAHKQGALHLHVLLQNVKVPAFTACIGLDGRQPVMLCLTTDQTAHVVITGTGAEQVLRTLLAALAFTHSQAKWQIALLGALRQFETLPLLPHCLWPVATTLVEQMAILNRLIAELHRRQAGHITLPRLAVAMGDLALQGEAPEVQELIQAGASVGIHLLAIGDNDLSNELRQLFPVQIVGTVEDEAKAGEFVIQALGQEVKFTLASSQLLLRFLKEQGYCAINKIY